MLGVSRRQMSDQAERKSALEDPKWKQYAQEGQANLRTYGKTERQKKEIQTEARACRKWSRHMEAEMSGTKKGGKT